jgi:hypothetical protein
MLDTDAYGYLVERQVMAVELWQVLPTRPLNDDDDDNRSDDDDRSPHSGHPRTCYSLRKRQERSARIIAQVILVYD